MARIAGRPTPSGGEVLRLLCTVSLVAGLAVGPALTLIVGPPNGFSGQVTTFRCLGCAQLAPTGIPVTERVNVSFE
jgi:hypothetical protein